MKCKGKTVQKTFPYFRSPCHNEAWKDGYCKIHHPDEKAKRDGIRLKKQDDKYIIAKKKIIDKKIIMYQDFKLIKDYLIERINLDAEKSNGRESGISAFLNVSRKIQNQAKNTEVLMALARLESVINREGK